jgi:ABC-type glycerol-3-phosphate transport system substrate-binding protein
MLAWLSLGALLLLAGGYALTRRRRSLALVLGLAALMSACGGINNLPQPGSTSAGSYVLTVTASGPSGQRSATLNLTVH